jgi:hypothetical protein
MGAVSDSMPWGSACSPASQPPLRSVEIRQDPPAALQIGCAGLRELEPPGGPGDEPDVEVLFQRAEMPAHRGQRHAQAPARGRKTALVRNGDEDPDGRETVHDDYLEIRNYEFTNPWIPQLFGISHMCVWTTKARKETIMAMLKLHDLELSGNCYKVRLLCALLGLDLDVIPVDFMAGAHKKSPLIDMNPFGEIPVLEDGDIVLRDSQAIANRRRGHGTRRELAHGGGKRNRARAE